jgi:hypothetical protein
MSTTPEQLITTVVPCHVSEQTKVDGLDTHWWDIEYLANASIRGAPSRGLLLNRAS